MDRLERELVAAERAACAELVGAFDCNCDCDGDGIGVRPRIGTGDERHYADCPQALAAAIEARTVALEPLRRPDRLEPEPSEPPREEFP